MKSNVWYSDGLTVLQLHQKFENKQYELSYLASCLILLIYSKQLSMLRASSDTNEGCEYFNERSLENKK